MVVKRVNTIKGGILKEIESQRGNKERREMKYCTIGMNTELEGLSE